MASKYFRRLSTTVSAAAVFGGDKSRVAKSEANIQSVSHVNEEAQQLPSVNDASASDPFDVQKLKDLLSKVSSSEEFSETSSVSTFRPGDNKKGSSKFGFGFAKKKKKLSVVLFSINDEFTRLRDHWVQRCNDHNIPLSSAVLAEFKKRIGQATGTKSKPKLNFAKCDLTDGQLIIFVEELAHRPVVAKLDLTGNHISTTGAEYLKKLLVYQLEVSTLLEPQQRVTATFLSDVALGSSKQTITKEIVDEIASVAGALAVCNVQNSIYELYMEISTPDYIDMATLTAMWEELLGTGPDRKALLLGRPGRTAQTASWTYAEAEALIIDEYRRRGLLPKSNASQEKALDSIKQNFEKRPSMSSVASSGDGNHAEGSMDGSGDWAMHDADEHTGHKKGSPVATSPSSSPKPPSGASKHVTAGHTAPAVAATGPVAEPEESYTSHATYVPDVVHADSGIAMQDEDDEDDGDLLEELEEAAEPEEPECKTDEYLSDPVGGTPLSREAGPEVEVQEPVLAMESPPAAAEVLPTVTKSPTATVEISAPPFKPLYTLPGRSKISDTKKDEVISAPSSDAKKSPTAKGPSPTAPVKLVAPAGSVPTTAPSAAPASNSAVKAAKTSGSIAQRYLQAVDHSGGGSQSPHSPKPAPATVRSAEKIVAVAGASLSGPSNVPAVQSPTLPRVPSLPLRSSAAATLFGSVDHDGVLENAEEPAVDKRKASSSSDQVAQYNNDAEAQATSAEEIISSAANSEPIDEQDSNASAFAIDLDDEDLDVPVVVTTIPPAPPSPSPAPPAPLPTAVQVLSAPVVPVTKTAPAAVPSGPAELDVISHSSSKVEVEEQPDLYSGSPESSVDGGELPASAVSLWHSSAFHTNGELAPSLHHSEQHTALYPVHDVQLQPTAAPSVPRAVAEPRVHAVLGISRKKFTAQEKDMLESLLPQCREVLSPHAREYSEGVRASDFLSPRRPGQDVHLIDLSSRDLMDSDFAEDEEISEHAASTSGLAVRNNRLSNLAALALPLHFPVLQELDLGFNYIAGRISMHMLPRTLLKLDLSHNGIIDYSGVMVCMNLKELNLSYNCIETIHALPKTLERLNIAHNYIWSKVCLRLLALTPKLASLSLEDNPVTLLVPGWAAMLRSMSNKLAHLDGRPVAPAHSAPVIGTPFTPTTNVLRVNPGSSRQSGAVEGKQNTSLQSALKSSPQKQKHQDEARSQLHAALVAEREEKRRLYMESLRKVANITSPSRPEEEILQHAKRLSSPKYAPSSKFQKKKGKPAVAGFGCGRSERDSFLTTNSDWSRREQVTSALSEPSRVNLSTASANAQVPKLNQAAALATVGEWSSQASQVLDSAVSLVNDLDVLWKAEHRIAQADDLHNLQVRADDLQLSEWRHLPVKVKLALHHLSKEQELVSTIMHLHEQIRNYATVLQQIRGALAMCVRDSRSFCQPFQIVMSSALGKSLTAAHAINSSSLLPAVKISRASAPQLHAAHQCASNEEKEVAEQEEVHEIASVAARSDVPSGEYVESMKPEQNSFVEDARSRLSARMLNSSTTSAAATANSSFSSAQSSAHSLNTSSQSLNTSRTSSSRSLRDRYFQALSDTTLVPWQTSASETLAQCADLLTEVLNFSAQTEAEKEGQEDKLQFLALFKAKRSAVEFAKFDKLPKDVSAAIAANSAAQLAVIDAQAAIRAFAKLFSQIENVLLLCIKSGLVFEPALQALMNSGLGRVVKKTTQGFKAVTIVAPRSRSPSPRRSPNARLHARSPALKLEVDEAPLEVSAPIPAPAQKAPSPRQKLTPHSTTLSLDLFAAAQEAFMATIAPQQNGDAKTTAVTQSSTACEPSAPSPRSQFSALDESTEELEFTVIDPNEDTVRRWMDRSEAALGQAAVLLNTLIDLASSSAALTERNIVSFRSELARLDLLSFEPPPKAVAAALLVCADEALNKTVLDLRQRLDDYDNLFGQVENALLLSVEDGHNFRKSFDVLMRTDLGVRVNESAYGIYDY